MFSNIQRAVYLNIINFFLGILTKGTGTHHLPLSMPNPPTNYSPTLARLLTAPERCKQSRGKQRQAPTATVVSSNTVNLLIHK